jgi:hypothetical protein
MSDMTEWDKMIAPALRSIEENSMWIKHNCERINEYSARLEYAIKKLKQRPTFDTRARDELTKSIAALHTTLSLCRSALNAYDNLPVMLEAAE